MSDVSFDYAGRVVAVTGAAIGIGKSTASTFARAGADVCLLDSDEQAGAEAARDGGTFLRCDVTSVESIDEAFATIAEGSGRLDVLVNNAGGFGVQRTTDEVPLEEWDRLLDLNLSSVFKVCQRALPLLRSSEAGRIINMGSLAGQLSSYRVSPPYAAAKAGLNSMTVGFRRTFGPKVRVNCIMPGSFLTDVTKAWDMDAFRQFAKTSMALGRGGEPGEIVGAALYFASAASSFTTGAVLGIHGGV